jgi:hypothetical protein
MANPVLIPTTTVWSAVATSVTGGVVWLADTRPKYLYTYRETGDPAPTDDTDARIVVSNKIKISHSTPIDVYMRSNIAGTVLVAL